MKIKRNKKLSVSIGFLILFLLASCDDYPKTTQVSTSFSTPTKIIPTKALIPTKTPLPQVSAGTVLVKSLNIRSGPGTNYAVISSMKQGDEFYILADVQNQENQKWLLIPLPNDSFGWVIGEQKYVTEKWVNVDYATYMMLVDAVRRAKLIYEATPTAAYFQQPIPTVNSQTIPSSTCTCSYNAYNCRNFPTQSSAQSCYNYCMQTVGYDVHWLDDDGDGIACEWNP